MAGSMVLDLQQMLSPSLVVPSCQEQNQWLTRAYRDGCVWKLALAKQDGEPPDGKLDMTVHIDIQERNRLPQATVTVTLPAAGPMADAIRRGEAVRRPDAFISEVAGDVSFDNTYTAWGAPTMSPGADGHVVVTATGSPLLYARAGLRRAASVEVAIRPAQYPMDLTVTTTERAIVASHVPRTGTKVDEGKLTARLPGGYKPWTVTLGSDRPPADFISDPATTTPAWWKRAEPVAGAVLKSWGEFTGLLLGAVPWILLLFASHTGVFGPMRQRPEWGRYLRLTGLVLAVHVCVAVVLTAQFDQVVQTEFNANEAFLRHVDGWVPWLTDKNVSVNGMSVLLLAAGLSLLPAVVRRAMRLTPALHQRRSVPVWGLPALPLLVGGTVVIAGTEPFDEGTVTGRLVGALALSGGALVVLAILAACARPLLRAVRSTDAPPPPPLSNFVITSVVFAGFAIYHSYFGHIPLAARWIFLLLTGATAVLCLVALWFRTVAGRPLGRRTRYWLTPAALALSMPWYDALNPYAGWGLFVNFAQGLDGLLALLLVTAGVLTLRRIGRGPVTSEVRLRGHRAIGIAVAVIVLSNSYSFYRAPSVWVLLAAVAGAFFLLPSGQVARATAVLGQDAAAHRRALGTTVMAGAARRQLLVARRTSRDKTAEEGGSLAAQQQVIRRLELVAWRDRDTSPGGNSPAIRERALGTLTSPSPWRRGVWAARWGVVFGLPWMALDLAGTASLPQDDPYPLLSAAGALLPPALRWMGIGLLFGYFFPLLGGQTGLAKAMRVAIAAGAPTLLDAVLVPHSGPAWPMSVLTVVQVLAFSMSLGLLADRDSLALGRYPWARLADVHNLGSLTAWASSVAAALATAVAALVLVGVQPFVTDLVQPPAPTSQPNPPVSTDSP
ncbi:hypothetical protein [Streptomyces sp. NBC_00827]|uniref:hypothetical protein n=1 Tax=Streptomyces sp. NBC_00827 TaxID=2903677 RepID=UPI00386EF693|nr:hypothetical protein OG569_03480 [Streptomyces sp. NBC_00827]